MPPEPPAPGPPQIGELLDPLFWPIVLGGAAVLAAPLLGIALRNGTDGLAEAIARIIRRAVGAGRSATPAGPPYRAVPSLLTGAERNFYRTLRRAKGAGRVICPKVRLADLVEVSPGAHEPLRHFRKISQKHLDFVICEDRSLRPLLVVELDDRSHDSPPAKKADAEKDAALAAAGIPILRVRAAGRYRLDAVKDRLEIAIEG